MKNALDDFLSVGIVGVGLAGIDDLHGPGPGRNLPKPLDVVEEQAGPFVCRRPAGVADGKDVNVHPNVVLPVDVLNEPLLGSTMGLPNVLFGKSLRVAQAEGVLPPSGNTSVEQLLERPRSPGRGVDAVGNRVDGVLGEHTACDLGVPLGDTVDIAAQVQSEEGHVQNTLASA